MTRSRRYPPMGWVVRREHVDFGVLAGKPAEASLVSDSLGPVGGHHCFEQPDPRSADSPGPVDLPGVEEGVPGVERPACGRLDGHAAMTAGVPEERHGEDLGRQPVELADGPEPVPGLSFF
jgi:hypothetical protein